MHLLMILLVSFPVRIAVIGDRTGSPDDVEFEIAVNAILEMCPDIVLSVGDFVEGNGDVNEAVADWENIMPVLERLTAVFPFVFTPGNNDIWNDETAEYWKLFTGTEPSRIEDILGITFVVWDSSIGDSLTAEDLTAIENLIDEKSSSNPWIFVTHKPFWFMAWQDSTVIDDFKRLMEEKEPLAVVGGHIHLLAAQRENGILYLSAGPSGSSVPCPDPAMGDFTQLGWMTVWPDSIAFAAVDARAVYPETVNTGEEMNIAYLYEQQFVKARPLEQELESAVLTLLPVENRLRNVSLDIEPGTWNLKPESLELEIEDQPVELLFTQSPAGSPYPSPEITVSLEYGSRDRDLQLKLSWPVLRRADAFRSAPVLDGFAMESEYREPFQTDFADFSGQPSLIPKTGFTVSNDGDRLFILMNMTDPAGDCEDYGGFIFGSPDDSALWLKVFNDGSLEALILTPEGELTDWDNGIDAQIASSDGSWCIELAVDIDQLKIEDGQAFAHVYRTTGEDFGTWVYPIDFDTSSMGRIWIER